MPPQRRRLNEANSISLLDDNLRMGACTRHGERNIAREPGRIGAAHTRHSTEGRPHNHRPGHIFTPHLEVTVGRIDQ